MDVEEYGASPNNETQEELVLSEVVSRREENVKHFDLGHGRFQAVAYGNAVHRKDENGVWQDIDNRLYPAKDRADLYATADGRTTVSAYSHSSKALITLRENGYVIALAPVFTQTAEKLKAASAVEIQNHKENIDLVLKPYTGSNNQKWKITLTSYGSYKIKAKSSESITDRDLVMVVQTNILYSEGLNIQQRQYVDNTSYKDEWILQPYSVVFYGVTNSGHDHISSLNSIQTTMLNGNWKSVTVRSGAITANQCKNDLLSTNVFTSRSHGQLVLRAGTTTEVSTGIVLNDNDGSNKVVFYGHAWNGMESGSGSIDSGENYSNIDVVLFIGCNTAYGGNGGRNLPAAIVDQGARAAVGFKDSIDCVEANTWTTNFYNKMLQGATLQEAVDYACGEFSENSPLRSAVICGDETITLI